MLACLGGRGGSGLCATLARAPWPFCLDSAKTRAREGHRARDFRRRTRRQPAMTLKLLALSGCAIAIAACGCPTALCGAICCSSMQSCVEGSCCDSTQICGSRCCVSGLEVCLQDSAGGKSCVQACTFGSECGSTYPACCTPIATGDGGFLPFGGCVYDPSLAIYGCICANIDDCIVFTSSSCAPRFNDAGVITGPYVCVSDDASAAGAGCGRFPAKNCPSTTFCSGDSQNNDFCSPSCTSDAVCGNPGIACCNATCSAGSCCGLCSN